MWFCDFFEDEVVIVEEFVDVIERMCYEVEEFLFK